MGFGSYARRGINISGRNSSCKAGKSGEVWHVRRREYVPPNGAVEVSTGRGAIAESPQGSTDFIPGAMGSQSKALEPKRPLCLLMLPGVGCC